MRVRVTTFRLILAVAICAELCLFAIVRDPVRNRARERYERCIELAQGHGSTAAEYRRNARGDGGMLRSAQWHELMRAQFLHAAAHPELPVPASQPFPPQGWKPRDDVANK